MSSRHRAKRRDQPAEGEGLWVRTEPTVDGTSYMVTVNVDDRAWALTPDQAQRYAMTCLEVCQVAEFDGALVQLLHRKLGLPLQTAVEFLAYDIRRDRKPVDDTQTAPLRFSAGVNDKTEPFIVMELDGERIGQLSPNQLRAHALTVLEGPVAADLDAALHRALVGTLGLEDGRARHVIADVGNFRGEWAGLADAFR